MNVGISYYSCRDDRTRNNSASIDIARKIDDGEGDPDAVANVIYWIIRAFNMYKGCRKELGGQ